jgi:hypothetical protein
MPREPSLREFAQFGGAMGENLRSTFNFSISASGTEMVRGMRFAEEATGCGGVLKVIEAIVEFVQCSVHLDRPTSNQFDRAPNHAF